MDAKRENNGGQNDLQQQDLSSNEDFSQDEVYGELEFSDQAVISGIVHHLVHPGEAEEDCEEETT
ncbi:hypothetical protein [Fictibacillus sp. KU28468]|uniref:hypothetical protein n=1 Tax=Fictibacillus sp. KU28468 TaxID=2991053 RepID=UPI00223D5974|nr:hypothetical protein [Fictibacillus sp. KU28468]UZJ79236.1 hypothetical protein OKX00_01735 [Fictibacillus sp. KU28468]